MPTSASAAPTTLYDAGCFSTTGTTAADLYTYEVNAALWADLATKSRSIGPLNGNAATVGEKGVLVLPTGTGIFKNFHRDAERLETRVLFAGETNQLLDMQTRGVLEGGDLGAITIWPTYDGNAPLASRARSYLAANCSFCHRLNGASGTNVDFRFDTAFDAVNVCNVTQSFGEVGGASTLLLPGDANGSVISQRMHSLSTTTRMPPVGHVEVDEVGTALITAYCVPCHDPNGVGATSGITGSAHRPLGGDGNVAGSGNSASAPANANFKKIPGDMDTAPSRDWTHFANIEAYKSEILSQVFLCEMPPPTVDTLALDATYRTTLMTWLQCGAQNN